MTNRLLTCLALAALASGVASAAGPSAIGLRIAADPCFSAYDGYYYYDSLVRPVALLAEAEWSPVGPVRLRVQAGYSTYEQSSSDPGDSYVRTWSVGAPFVSVTPLVALETPIDRLSIAAGLGAACGYYVDREDRHQLYSGELLRELSDRRLWSATQTFVLGTRLRVTSRLALDGEFTWPGYRFTSADLVRTSWSDGSETSRDQSATSSSGWAGSSGARVGAAILLTL